ncbi:MAG TPA: hypothetical protein VIF62_17635 [Labilithrix sp.]
MRALISIALVALVATVGNEVRAQQTKKSDPPNAAQPAPAPAPAPPPADDDKPEPRALVLSLDLGVGHTDLGGLHDNLSFDKTAANGGVYGGGAGVRLKQLRFGARFRGEDTTEFTTWSVLAEAGYGFKMRPFEPTILLHAGWQWSTAIEPAVFRSAIPPLNTLPPNVRVHGPTVGLEAQALYYVAKAFGIGPFLGFDVSFLSRPQVDLPQSLVQLSSDTKQNPLYTDSGSGIAWTVQIGARALLDLGL